MINKNNKHYKKDKFLVNNWKGYYNKKDVAFFDSGNTIYNKYMLMEDDFLYCVFYKHKYLSSKQILKQWGIDKMDSLYKTITYSLFHSISDFYNVKIKLTTLTIEEKKKTFYLNWKIINKSSIHFISLCWNKRNKIKKTIFYKQTLEEGVEQMETYLKKNPSMNNDKILYIIEQFVLFGKIHTPLAWLFYKEENNTTFPLLKLQALKAIYKNIEEYLLFEIKTDTLQYKKEFYINPKEPLYNIKYNIIYTWNQIYKNKNKKKYLNDIFYKTPPAPKFHRKAENKKFKNKNNQELNKSIDFDEVDTHSYKKNGSWYW